MNGGEKKKGQIGVKFLHIFFSKLGLLTRERSFALANNSLSSESEQIDPARFKFRGFGEPVEESRSDALSKVQFGLKSY